MREAASYSGGTQWKSWVGMFVLMLSLLAGLMSQSRQARAEMERFPTVYRDDANTMGDPTPLVEATPTPTPTLTPTPTPTPPATPTPPTTASGNVSGNVSGTSVVVMPQFTPGSKPIVSGKLTIGDTEVRSWIFDPPLSAPYNGTITWDSTHFSHGQKVKIKVESKDISGLVSSNDYTVTIYNKAYLLGITERDYDGEQTAVRSVTELSPIVSSMNHAVDVSITDLTTQIIAKIPDYTVFYANTHGAAYPTYSVFGDSSATESSSGNYVRSSEVSTAVAKKTTQPPYNFVNMNACQLGSTNTLSNSFGTSSTNRAFVGFDINVQINEATGWWVNDLWDFMAKGFTVTEAIRRANLDSPGRPFGYPVGGGTRTLTVPTAYGDPNMKLHGVYGGAGTDWFVNGSDNWSLR